MPNRNFMEVVMKEESPFRSMAAKWRSSLVARSEIPAFTGGLISEKYICNLDSAKKGPANRVRVGKKVAYPVADLIEWLESRTTTIPSQGSEDFVLGKSPERRQRG